MNKIVLMEFGSSVYDTRLSTSDTDYKGIYIPETKNILLGKVKHTIVQTTKTDKSVRNTSEDVDTELFSLQQYLKLVLEGQTVAVDILFTPEKFYVEGPSYTWLVLKKNKDKLLHSGYNGFINYCYSQASKYGIKGSRVNAVRRVLEFLKDAKQDVKLYNYSMQLATLVKDQEYMSICEINGPRGIPELHLEVCNRKVPYHSKVEYAVKVYQKIFDNYGQRALQAEANFGIDYKALMHVVRIIHQSKELLSTGHITFPRPEKDLLLKIRKGEMSYKQIAEIMEEGLDQMESWSENSILPKEPNKRWVEDFIFDTYLNWIKR